MLGEAGSGGAGRAGTEPSLQSLFTSSLLPCSPLHPPPSHSNTPPPLEESDWDSIPSQLPEFRSSGAAVRAWGGGGQECWS